MIGIVIGDPVCPICHSDVVKGYKVHSQGVWWSRCISGIDHGEIVFPDGEVVDVGIDYEHIYFTDDGLVSYEPPGGNYRPFTVDRQERV